MVTTILRPGTLIILRMLAKSEYLALAIQDLKYDLEHQHDKGPDDKLWTLDSKDAPVARKVLAMLEDVQDTLTTAAMLGGVIKTTAQDEQNPVGLEA